jgi:hypothetical protein
MSAESALAKVVRVNIEYDTVGLFYATSPDLKGLLVAESTEEATLIAVPKAISDLYLAMGQTVVVIPAGDMAGDHPMKTWVGVPSSMAHCLEFA